MELANNPPILVRYIHDNQGTIGTVYSSTYLHLLELVNYHRPAVVFLVLTCGIGTGPNLARVDDNGFACSLVGAGASRIFLSVATITTRSSTCLRDMVSSL